jgi:hypothetical protein
MIRFEIPSLGVDLVHKYFCFSLNVNGFFAAYRVAGIIVVCCCFQFGSEKKEVID